MAGCVIVAVPGRRVVTRFAGGRRRRPRQLGLGLGVQGADGGQQLADPGAALAQVVPQGLAGSQDPEQVRQRPGVVGQVPAHGGGQVAGLGLQPLRPLAVAARGRVAEFAADDTGRAVRSGALGRIRTVRSGLAAQGSGIGPLRGCAGSAYLRAPAVLISGPSVAARAAGASRRGLPAKVPSVMPVPVMKTSSSTPAG